MTTGTPRRGRDPNLELLGQVPAEGVVMLLCAGPATNDAEFVRRLEGPLDWRLLEWLADEERATSILWRRVNRLRPELIPEAFRPNMQRGAMLADFSALYLEERTGATLGELASIGITPMLLKGAALAKTAFDGFIDRPMGDVDLLVEPPQAQTAWDVARKTGWLWDEQRYPAAHYAGHHHLPPLLGSYGTDTKLEIHSSLFVEGHPFRFSEAELYKDSREVVVGGHQVLAPASRCLLMHVALHHAWSHMMGFGGWRAVRDVSVLCENAMDWDGFLALALDERAASACYWMLRLSRELVGADVPDEVIARLAATVRVPMGSVIERHFTRDLFPLAGGCPSSRMSRWMWSLAMQPGRSGHGATRPWLIEDPPSHNRRPPTFGDEMLSLAKQIGRVGEWWRYAWGLIS